MKKVLISRDSLHGIQSSFLSAVIYPFLNLTPLPPLPHFEAVIKPISLIIGLTPDLLLANFPRGRGEGVISYKRLLGMCHWMGSHFHDWSDCNGVAFSTENGVANFWILGVSRDSKWEDSQ